MKSWIKRHKTVLSVGTTAVIGISLSVVLHRIGYNNGYDKGFKDGAKFNAGETIEF